MNNQTHKSKNKQTRTVTVIHYSTNDRQLLIAHCSSHR